MLSALAGLAVLAFALYFYNTPVVNLMAALIIVAGVYELLMATGYIQNRVLSAICMGFGGLVPFLRLQFFAVALPVVCFLFAFALFVLLLIQHKTMRMEQIGLSFFLALSVSFSVNCLILMRDRFGVAIGIFGLFLTFSSAWLSDTGAFFVGRAMGRRKLCPTISPKKTVEGMIGGLFFSLAGNLLIPWLLAWIFLQPAILPHVGATIRINYTLVTLISPVLSLLGVLGDLSASVLKRQYNIKDYGNIMPGHGGVMDRFDSVLFIAPAVYICMLYLPLVWQA